MERKCQALLSRSSLASYFENSCGSGWNTRDLLCGDIVSFSLPLVPDIISQSKASLESALRSVYLYILRHEVERYSSWHWQPPKHVQ
jgi:hypothetical protein